MKALLEVLGSFPNGFDMKSDQKIQFCFSTQTSKKKKIKAQEPSPVLVSNKNILSEFID